MRAIRAGLFLFLAAVGILMVLLFWAAAIGRQPFPWRGGDEIWAFGMLLHARELVLLTLITIPFAAACIARGLQLLSADQQRFAHVAGLPLAARVSALAGYPLLIYACIVINWSAVFRSLRGEAAMPPRELPALTDKNVKFPSFPLQQPDPYAWELSDLEGKPVAFAQFKQKPVFLNFWATWCGPCRMEMPNIQKLYEALKEEGIHFAMVSQEPAEDVKKFLTENKYSFPIYLSKDDPPAPFSVGGIPATYILAPDGKIAVHHVGSTGWDGERTQKFLRDLKSQTPAS